MTVVRAALCSLAVLFTLPHALRAQTCVTACVADCDDGGAVTVDELLRAVAIALDAQPLAACGVADRNGDGAVTADELVAGVAVALQGCRVAAPPEATPGAVVPEDLATRALPDWYADAKLGIMIHWGPFAVPAWAERTLDPEVIFTDPTDPNYFFSAQGVEAFLQHNPYSEWYLNSMSIAGSGTQQHHVDTWGDDFTYEQFAPLFEAQLGGWHPNTWARIFQDAGARYVVLVTKHHDGYTLWPSEVTNPNRPDGWHAERDVVGELSDAVRGRCMRMGLYYSGGIDWTWAPPPYATLLDALRLTPPQPEYAGYVDEHWRELIRRYRPAVLWNDIAAPAGEDSEQLFRDYYAEIPDGVVNDRWTSGALMPHRDFRTAEFSTDDAISPDKWEAVRGMSRGFGYNQNETDADYGPPEKFVHLLIDVVSKNGNLLLNVGPRADGSIPEPQLRILARLGRWLKLNGEAIYETRPWTHHASSTDQGVPVRFTSDPLRGVVFAILLGTPAAGTLTIDDFEVTPTAVHLVETGAALEWTKTETGLQVTLPALPADGLAHALRIDVGA
ncbi:MAG: alpha-L-fucosidase [Deltaproteobacteria bacterium]|nr:alpha-L-fucosidase [Deltaproteobacteria bacterium]